MACFSVDIDDCDIELIKSSNWVVEHTWDSAAVSDKVALEELCVVGTSSDAFLSTIKSEEFEGFDDCGGSVWMFVEDDVVISTVDVPEVVISFSYEVFLHGCDNVNCDESSKSFS